MVNYIAVIFVGLLSYILLGLWYSKFLFGKLWMKLTKSKNMGGSASVVIIGLIAALVTSFILSVIVTAMSAVSFINGAAVGLLIWIGFVVPFLLNEVLYEKRSFTLYMLNATGYLIILVIAGGVLAVWT